MSKKRLTAIAAVILILLCAVFLFVQKPVQAPSAPPELTRERALELLKIDGCAAGGEPERYRSCETVIVAKGESATVTVTHDGFFDDSVKASRVEAVLSYRDGAWRVVSSAETQLCWPNRGHQDFSAELCI